MGDVDTALLYIAKAVEMEPDNPHFRSNLGWIYLIANKMEEADKTFVDALRLDPDNEAVKGNLEIHRYLTKHGGNHLDYLLRSADKEGIDRLADEEKWEEMDKLCTSYNDCRVEAMAQALLQEDEHKRSRLADLLATLSQFFRFVQKVDQSGYMLNEDLTFIHENFKPIMHKFIFKLHDIDREMIEKMQRYNMIRHNGDMDEEEKEPMREELFEGDHAWPFL
jgi:tetratricopeptide (TPR) repeat protein